MPRWITSSAIATLVTFVIVALASFAVESVQAESPDNPTTGKKSRNKTLAYSRKIDALIEGHLKSKELSRNPDVDDATFLRRVYLTAIGRIPTIEEADEFLASEASQKRSDLIDELLGSYGYVSHQFNFFADLLRIKTKLDNQAPGAPYIDYVKDALEENMPYDQLVYELLAADGALLEKGNGAVGYYLRDRNMPEDNMSNTVRVFLGTRLECAQCHDHPFDKWTQRQYFEMVAFTGGINYRKNKSSNEFAKQVRNLKKNFAEGKINGQVAAATRRTYQALSSGIGGSGTGLARLPKDYEGSDGDPNEIVTAKEMFGGESIIDVKIPKQRQAKKKNNRKNKKLNSRIRGAKEIGSREAYAQWLTEVDNPRFAKVIANRIWKRAFGLGLVEPVDVMEDSTVASNPELLDYLTEVMIEIEFDMQEFYRIIYNTKAWQAEVTRSDIVNVQQYGFQGPVMRRMSAEQLWDSMIGLTVDSIDRRSDISKRKVGGSQVVNIYEYYETLKDKSPLALYKLVEKSFKDRGMMTMDDEQSVKPVRDKTASKKKWNKARKENQQAMRDLNRKINAARRAGNTERMRRLMIKRTEVVSKQRSKSKKYLRASELQSPAPANHLLREFGQSDRETIENSNTDPAVTQVLRLMNGCDTLSPHRFSVSAGTSASSFFSRSR